MIAHYVAEWDFQCVLFIGGGRSFARSFVRFFRFNPYVVGTP